MAGVIWREVFTDSAYNTAVAASGSETVKSTASNRHLYAPFNRLLVHNRDAIAIKMYLDGLDIAGNIFQLAAGEILIIEPEDGITFTTLKIENLDSATAETADTILYRWAKAVKVV